MGIYIDIDSEALRQKDIWEFTIDQKETGHSGDDSIYKTRKKAETASYKKAFKILEKQ